jgi:hypothetical protein
MTGFLATPADENEFAGRLVPSEPAPFLRLRRFNELAVFSEEKKNGALFIGSRVTPRINDANNTLAGLKPYIGHSRTCWPEVAVERFQARIDAVPCSV